MSLELNTVKTRGRAEQVPNVLSCEPITAEDMVNLRTRDEASKPAPLQRLKSRHKQIARAIASGATTSAVAAEFGISSSRVSVLKADKTFQDQIAFYEATNDKEFDNYGNLQALNSDAIEEARRRLEEEPDSLEMNEILKLIQIASDRSGTGPKRTEETNLNVNFGERLDQARNRVREKLIDITPEAAE